MKTARQERVNRHKRSRMRKKQEKQKRRLLQLIDSGEITVLYFDMDLGVYRIPGGEGSFMGDANGDVQAVVIGPGSQGPYPFRRLSDDETIEIITTRVRHRPIDPEIPF